MSLAGFKKQFNKTSQYLSEKVGDANGSVPDEQFTEMERKSDVMGTLVEGLIARTIQVLQPNPSARAKLAMQADCQKAHGESAPTRYPQPESLLADCMTKHGNELGDDSLFGEACVESGETYSMLAELKDGMEVNVKQNFLDPLRKIQNKDLTELNHHRKTLESRRLDYDYKKGKGETDEELQIAKEKFEESKSLTEMSMFCLLENDVEQISALAALIEAEADFYLQSGAALKSLSANLQRKIADAASRPRQQLVPSTVDNSDHTSTGPSVAPAAPVAPSSTAATGQQPCANALYDFDPENEGELGFKEGDVINLTGRIDENWYEGYVHGQAGFFPENYVEVIISL